MVPGRIHFIIRQLPPDIYVLEHGFPIQQELNHLVDLGDAENMLLHGSPLIGTAGQVVPAHVEMVRQGAEIV